MYFRNKALRLQLMSEKFHQEAPPENAHEFSHRIKALFLPKMWLGLLSKQQYENALQKMYFKNVNVWSWSWFEAQLTHIIIISKSICDIKLS